ncbi:MAG TPA: hypothetical protein VLV82_07320, partial [Candidatus Angelobacter sp.]|nr:hypothetical protein [Candidatus Angelobacter sp.]
MTAETTGPRLGSLGWRLLAAFALVAVGAVGLVLAAALVGTTRGIDQAGESERARVAVSVAVAAAAAYRAAGGWDDADLDEAEALAAAAGARVVIIAADGTVVSAVPSGDASGTPGAAADERSATSVVRPVVARLPLASPSPGRLAASGTTSRAAGPP